ncbi:hypothetical protein LNQ52_23210 [Klebsiella pneumoniae subsp. pneumoniae]|nr:hypothetical protein [Klebsiella pneumoniae subsp. pneumoniae]
MTVMRNFILRRLLQTLPMLLLASFIIFCCLPKPRRLYRWQYHPDRCPRRGAEGDLRPRPAAIDPLPPLAGTVAAR